MSRSIVSTTTTSSFNRCELTCRYPHTATRGRHSTPVEVILRMLIVNRLFSWPYEETEYFVGDSLVLRELGGVYPGSVPNDTTFDSLDEAH